jgi:hypothetical protein
MLGDELDVAVRGPTLRGVVFDAEIRQLDVPVDDRQSGRRAERLEFVGAIRVLWTIGTMQEQLVLALEFLIEDDAGDAPALRLDPCSLRLI